MPEPAKRAGGVNSFSGEFASLPSDEDFLRAFFGLTLANSEFRHRDHLRLAWLAVRRHGDGAAEEVVTAGIRRFA